MFSDDEAKLLDALEMRIRGNSRYVESPRHNLGRSSSHVDLSEQRLYGVEGAQIAIKELQHRKAVSRLLLGHNHLGDEGTECLFKFLSSPDGQFLCISELALNSNEIGDKGLRAISRYLTEAGPGALALRELFLQGNIFTSDLKTVTLFVSALNKSHITKLNITTNSSLSDSFISSFLPNLHSSTLESLHLSAIGLTPLSCDTITSFLSACSRPLPVAIAQNHGADAGRIAHPSVTDQTDIVACPMLQHLSLNANHLGFKAIKKIVATITRENYHLASLEVFSNCFVDVDERPPPVALPVQLPAWLASTSHPSTSTATAGLSQIASGHSQGNVQINGPANENEHSGDNLQLSSSSLPSSSRSVRPRDDNTSENGLLGLLSPLNHDPTLTASPLPITSPLMHSNSGTEEEEEDEDDAKTTMSKWQECINQLRQALARNSVLSNNVHEEALRLLRISRPVLLRRRNVLPSASSPSDDDKTLSSSTTIISLPSELIFDILSIHAGSFLSPAQRIRIFRYAEDPATLPPDPRVLPPLPIQKSAPLRRNLAMFSRCDGFGTPPGTDEKRQEWLITVGCAFFERA